MLQSPIAFYIISLFKTLIMSVVHQQLSFRPARNIDELQALFHLRHQVYLESRCAALVADNEHGFELDAYDAQAHHLGLFQGGLPVGVMRLVQESPTPTAAWVAELSARYGLPVPVPEAEEALPLLAHCEEKPLISAHLSQLRSQGAGLVEASRFVLAPDSRAAGFARFFVEAAMARVFHYYGYGGVLIACHPRHAAMYLRYGFEQVIDGRQHHYKDLAASVLSMQAHQLRPALTARISELGLIQQRYGEVKRQLGTAA